MNIGEIYTCKIEKTNIFGNGICYINGTVVFVLGALCGDVCEIKITEISKKYAYAEILSIKEKSPYRKEAECEHFLKCGGCSFLHTYAEYENEIKLQNVKDIFSKSKIECDFDKIVAPVCEKYRNKVVLFYGENGFGYKESKSDKTIEHKKCLLNPPVFDEIAEYVAQEIGNKNLRALFIRQTSKGEIMVCPIFRKDEDISAFAEKITARFENTVSVWTSSNNDKDFALENCKFVHVFGKNTLNEQISGIDYEISPESFFQINHRCAELLYDKIIEYVKEKKPTLCADLFCGTGTIGLAVAKKTRAKIIGVEINPKAVENAISNAKRNNINGVEFFTKDAKDFNEKVDLCIIDPPRKGCSDLMCKTLLRLLPETIIYVSCNPSTLVRDLQTLSNKYKISKPVTLFNMFPKTSHVESVVCIARK